VLGDDFRKDPYASEFLAFLVDVPFLNLFDFALFFADPLSHSFVSLFQDADDLIVLEMGLHVLVYNRRGGVDLDGEFAGGVAFQILEFIFF
jgi:hypothetical protein